MEKINRIKDVLADEGKTRKWLAKQVGRGLVTVSKWCTNTSQPDLTTLSKIAETLNVNMGDLLCHNFKTSAKV